MYLSSLDIIGFKSFAQKTKFKFTDGITAIVGPNGCGKTNIVDAIRWVLGEQKTSVLRSEIMENVIFNGSGGRKPLGMAEVCLTVMNDKNVLPSEYNEVSITRRLFRNGDSQYLLNNSQCRLRDIVDLFMDTGLGADSYSVIELKMIEAILNGKPEERRHLLEEAAGVTKYKLRRKEASRKLANVQGDITRIDDIIAEVRKNVNTLQRQAAKTMRYNKLLEQFKDLDLKILKHEYLLVTRNVSSASIELEKMVENRKQQEEYYTGIEMHLADLQKNLEELEQDFRIKKDDEMQLQKQFAQKNQEIAIMNEKKSAIIATNKRNNEDIDQLKDSLVRTGITTEKLQRRILENEDFRSSIIKDLDDIRVKHDSTQNQVKQLRETYTKANEKVLNLTNSISGSRSAILKNLNKRDNLKKRLSDNESEIAKLENRIEETLKKAIEIDSNAPELTKSIDQSRKNLEQAQEERTTLQTEIEKIQSSINEEKQSLSRFTAQHEFLAGFVEASESVKFLLGNKEWMPEAGKQLLAENIVADDNYKIAIAAALGDLSDCFIITSEKEATTAIDILKRKSKGKASFLDQDRITEQIAPGEFPNEQGFIGWISEIVNVDDKLRNTLRALIGKTMLVQDNNSAARALEIANAEVAITLAGELITSKGVYKGGSTSSNEGVAIGKRQKIASLEKSIDKCRKKITELESDRTELKKKFDSINLSVLSNNLRNAENARSSSEQLAKQISIQKDSFQANLELLRSNRLQIQGELSEIEKEDTSSEEIISNLENDLLSAKNEFQTVSDNLRINEKDLSDRANTLKQYEMDKVRLETDNKALSRDIERLTNQKTSTGERINRLDKEIGENLETIDKLNNDIKTFDEERSSLSAIIEESSLRLVQLQERIKSLQDQVHQYNADVTAGKKVLDRIVENIHNQEIKIHELKSEEKNLVEKATEKFELVLEGLDITEEPEFSLEETKTHLSEIKEKLNSLGSVNFMALEEFQTQSERLKFLEDQVKDLVDSERTLQETIKEINITAEERFKRTFEEVNNNFKVLFTKLFGGDSQANLILTEGDTLESDIQIMAKPQGKKPHSIEMLSGGEKTLTAIALLFAIYMVKPSPFCILDEVDAPLDDANIDRFLNLIRDFSINTQFFVVTHNKRTMEFSDTLYGITMQEEGVSRVVSAKLQQDSVQ